MRKSRPSGWLFLYLNHTMKKNTKAVDKKVIPYLSAGMMVGLLMGSLTDNIGLWLSLGLAIGASVGYARVERK